ncbi:phage tail tape measure protein [Streptomyces sp. NPDC020800]|uniref:phage tail tape measure protein n=1 Tax=Streptomyces sp. NPDC020800 TaxID=3365092 RepID=UPI0037B13877
MASTGIIYTLIARDAASRTFRQVSRAAGGTDSTLSKLAKTAKVAGEAIAVGLAAGLAEGAKSAAEFQSEMTRIQTQAGGTARDVKVLSDQVLKLGTSTQQGPQALAESLYHLKSVGMDNVSAMKALKEASDLAAVGHANLEETTNALAGAWRTGIKGATSFHEAVSTVNAIIGAGNMSMDQFNAAIGTGILPSAKTFGLSMKQVGAALALMTDEGIDSASAATRLRMSFSLLGAPSGAAEKQLKKIGLTGLQLAEAMRSKDGLIGAIRLLKDHLDKSGMSASKQSQLLSRAFGGGRSSSGILLMLNNLDVLEKKQEQINRSTGKFDDAVKQQRKTAEAQWHLLTSNLEVMGIRIGTKVLPYATDFIHFLATKAMPAANRFGQTMASIIPVDRIRKAVGEVKSTVSGLLSGFGGHGGIGDFIDGLTGAKTKMPKTPKSPIDKFPTTVLTGPLQGAPHLGSGQSAPTKGPGKALQPLPHYGVGQTAPTAGKLGKPLAPLPHGGSGLSAPLITPVKAPKAPPKSLAQQIGQQIRIAFTDGITHVDWDKLGPVLGSGLGKAFEWLVSHGAELAKKLGQAIGKIDWVDVGKAFGGIALPLAIGFVDNLFEPLFHKDFWEKHWLDTILAVISVVPIGKVLGVAGKLFSKIPWGRLGEIFARIPWGKIIPFGAKLAEALPKIFVAINEFIGTIVLRFGQAIAARFPRVAAWFVRELALLPTRLGVIGLNLVAKGKQMIADLGEALVERVPGMGNRFIRAAAKVFGRFTLWQTGLNLAESLINGAWSKLKSIGSWMKAHLVNPVIHWVKSGFGIASPSKVFSGIGGNLVSGLKSGVLGAAKAIGGWIVDHLVTPVTSRFAHAGSWLVGKGSALVSGFKSGAWSVAKSVGSWISSHIVSPITSRFAKAGSWLTSKGSALLSGLKSGISGAMRGIGGWLKGIVVDPVVNSVKHFFGIKSPSRVFMSIGGHLVGGLIKGMSRTNGTAIAHKIFGSLPKALASIVKKGLVSVSSLPGQALKALGSLGGDILGLLGLGGGGGGSSANQKIGSTLAAVRGWTGAQWAALKSLWNGESGWNERALNKSTGAYGIPQCVDINTLILTRRGWLHHDEVRVGDETIGYNLATGRSEWTRITDVHHGVGELRRFGTSQWSAVSTPQHRWLVERTEALCDLPPEPGTIPYGMCQCGCGKPTKPARNPVPDKGIERGMPNLYLHGHHARGKRRNPDAANEYFVQQQELQRRQRIVLARPAQTEAGLDITVQEAALLAWIAGDGWQVQPRPVRGRNAEKGYKSGSRPMTYHIGQTKQQHWEAIEAAIDGHGTVARTRERHVNGEVRYDREWRLSAPYARDLTERAGNPKTDCVRQVLAMSTEQRAAWLDAIIRAEGNVTRKGNRASVTQITQKAGPLADAIVLAVYLSGRRPSVYVSKRTGGRHGMVPVWTITVCAPRTGERRETVGGKDCWTETSLGVQNVWCVTTELGTWTARQGDDVFLTGNSLPASKMASAGGDWKTNPATQIKWGLSYIASRYGNPLNAYSAWLSRSPHWYAKGTRGGAAPGLAWVGEKGPELVAFKGGEDVLSHPDSMNFARANGIRLPGYASGTIQNAGDRVRRDRQKVEDAKDAVAAAKRRRKGVQAAEKRLAAAEKELKAAEISLRNAQRSAKTSISNTIATGLAKTLSTGTSSAIASAVKSLATKLLNAGYNRTAASVQKRGSQLEKLADKRASLQKTIDAANAYASDQAGNIRDFLTISGTSATNVGDLISQAAAQQKTASNFVSLSKSLKARGASKDLLQALSDAGPGSQLATILGAKNVTTGDIAKLNKLMSSGNKLATSFGRDMADLMYDSGKDASKGFLSGLKSQQKALEKQMGKLAKALVDQVKKALKIKSPSVVMRDEIGKNIVLGWVHGMDAHSHLVSGAAQRLADASTGITVRRRYVPTAARAGAGADEVWDRLAAALESREGHEVHVHVNDTALKDLIDVRIKPKIKASERTQAQRAKVGRRAG